MAKHNLVYIALDGGSCAKLQNAEWADIGDGKVKVVGGNGETYITSWSRVVVREWRDDMDGWRVQYDENDDPWCRRKYFCPHCGKWQTYGETPFCPYCGQSVKLEEENG